MKRDPEIVRAILMTVERQSPILTSAIMIDGASQIVVYGHCVLLMGADYLDGRHESTLRERRLNIVGLTWKGHAFFETVKDEDDWAAIRADLKMSERTVPFEVIAEFARRRSRLSAGLPEIVEPEPELKAIEQPEVSPEPEGDTDEVTAITN